MGGHWLEMLKVQRQAGTYPSYFAAARHMWSELGMMGFYKGFWPWGFAQGCYKGLPVLFTQGEVQSRLQKSGVEKQKAAVMAGVTAGMVQGAMIAPTQRLKTMIGTNKAAGAVSTDIISKVIAKEGISTVFKVRASPSAAAARVRAPRACSRGTARRARAQWASDRAARAACRARA